MGWRVEFRSMEVQFTDFENAAFSIFIVLLSRAILTFGLNFYIPISKVGPSHVTVVYLDIETDKEIGR
jgi:glutamate--cysteine ligase catalytic subunit